MSALDSFGGVRVSVRSEAIFALFVGAVAALVDQLVAYVLVDPDAGRASNRDVLLATAVSAVVAGGGAVLSSHVLRRSADGVAPVDRFLGLVGLALNVFFLLVILGMGLPALVLAPTD